MKKCVNVLESPWNFFRKSVIVTMWLEQLPGRQLQSVDL